jgi:hypothetical protein
MEIEEKQVTSHVRMFNCLGVPLCLIVAACMKAKLFASRTRLRRVDRRKTLKGK